MKKRRDESTVVVAARLKRALGRACLPEVLLCATIVLLAASSLEGCGTRPKALTPRQQSIAQSIERVWSDDCFIAETDTVELSAPDTVLLDYGVDISVAFSGNLIAIGNRMERNVVLFSRDGKFIRTIGRRGSGPGEFQGVWCVAIDAADRIYVYDDQLGRVSIFNAEGILKSTLQLVGVPFHLVRDMAVGPTGLIFLHHVPSEGVPGFVSVWDSTGSLKKILLKPSDDKYRGYLERGFLDGGIQISPDGVLFETNAYSYRVSKVYPNWVETSFGEEPPDYRPLPRYRPSFEKIEEFERATSKVTLILQPFLLQSSGLLLQEVLNPWEEKLTLLHQVYDTSGIYLGTVRANHLFQAESGGYLLGLYPKYGSPKYGDVEQRIPYDIILYKERRF